MRKLLLVFLFTSSMAYGQELLTQYRLYGIQTLQKQLDLDLAGKEYWQNIIATIDTKYGYIQSAINLLTCNKKIASLELSVMDKNNSFQKVNSYSAFTGKYNGDKKNEGDKKTPIGIYNIVEKLDKVDSFYGPLALVTSYPNLYDTYNNKNGHGIWIHGVPTNQERDDYTKGCIAIGNQELLCLDKAIDYNKTLLIINETKIKTYPSKNELATILADLYAWRYAWIYNDVDKYLSFYDQTFKRFDGMEIEDFKRYKVRIFSKKEEKTINFKDIKIIPYPNYEKNLYAVTFTEEYHSKSFSFLGNKTLIVKFTNNTFKIITER